MQTKHRRNFPPGSWLIQLTMLLALWVGLPSILLAQIDQGTITVR